MRIAFNKSTVSSSSYWYSSSKAPVLDIFLDGVQETSPGFSDDDDDDTAAGVVILDDMVDGLRL